MTTIARAELAHDAGSGEQLLLFMRRGLSGQLRVSDSHFTLDVELGFFLSAFRPRIEAALEGLTGYIEEVIADRQVNPRDDLVTTLIQAHEGADALSRRELSVALVFLALFCIAVIYAPTGATFPRRRGKRRRGSRRI